MFSDAAGKLGFYDQNGAATRMLIDSSGNLGLGVSPSAWASPFKNIQVGNGAGFTGRTDAMTAYMSSNYYYNAGDKYIGTGNATLYLQGSGQHVWYNAASGTAGNAISFTQAMTLDAAGRLLVGATAATAIDERLNVTGRGIVTQSAADTNRALIGTFGGSEFVVGTFDNFAMTFRTNNTERARISAAGDLLVGTTALDGRFRVEVGAANWARVTNHTNSGTQYFDSFRYNGTEIGAILGNNTATSYVTSSDRRLKENIDSADDAGSVVDAIQIVKHDWKVGGHVRYGVIAQDLHAVAPEAVSVGDDGEEIERTWGVDYSKLVPMLVKEIQSLRARVAQLESK